MVHPAVPNSDTLVDASVTVYPIHIDQGSSNFWGVDRISYCTTARKSDILRNVIFLGICSEVKVSRNGPERRSGKRIIIAGTAFRLEFLVGWYYDADTTMAVPELY